MATKGGKRPGAGRKPGSVTKKSRAAAEHFAATGMTPLDVLIDCMTRAYDDEDYKSSAFYANMAAPYIHAKLSSITSNNTHQGSLNLVNEFPE